MSAWFIIIGLLVLLGVIVASKYNGMVTLRNVRKQSFADMDVQLKQRFDLIPNLIETLKGYTSHEKQTLENITQARTSFMNAGDNMGSKIQADNMLTGALKSLFAVSENYPDLKASTNFLEFQQEISDIENKIAASRRFFNNSTQEYNTYIEMFPNNILAGIFHFGQESDFNIDDVTQRENVSVKF